MVNVCNCVYAFVCVYVNFACVCVCVCLWFVGVRMRTEEKFINTQRFQLTSEFGVSPCVCMCECVRVCVCMGVFEVNSVASVFCAQVKTCYVYTSYFKMQYYNDA